MRKLSQVIRCRRDVSRKLRSFHIVIWHKKITSGEYTVLIQHHQGRYFQIYLQLLTQNLVVFNWDIESIMCFFAIGSFGATNPSLERRQISRGSSFGLHQFNLSRQCRNILCAIYHNEYFQLLGAWNWCKKCGLVRADVYLSFWPFVYMWYGPSREIYNMIYFSVASSAIWARCSLNISLFLAILCVYYTAARFITVPRICQTKFHTKVPYYNAATSGAAVVRIQPLLNYILHFY